MSPEPAAASPSDEVSLRIEAPASRVWSIVTDVAGMGRLSPECTGGRWLDGSNAAIVGARFKGTNRRGLARWSTTNTVVGAEPDRVFSFETKQSGVRWTYRLEADGPDATVVTESREEFAPRPLVAKAFAAVALGGVAGHEDELRDGMRATLERLKQVAEAG